MKYVDPDLITHVIKSVQQFRGGARQSGLSRRQTPVKLMLCENVICFIHLSERRSLAYAYKLIFIRRSDLPNLNLLRRMCFVILACEIAAIVS